MALFNNRDAKAEPSVKPQSAAPSPSPSIAPPPPLAAAAEKPAVAARAATAPGEIRAYLDSGAKVSGKLSFDGPARIDGQIDGEINAKDVLIIGETAVVTAQLRAASIVVAGKVSGDITAVQRIEIRPSAKVIGNLTSPVLVVHEGALFEGHCAMQIESARDERKVTAFAKEERIVPKEERVLPKDDRVVAKDERIVAQAGGHKLA